MKRNSDIEEAVRLFHDRQGMMTSVARRYAPSSDLIYDVLQQTFIDYLERFGPVTCTGSECGNSRTDPRSNWVSKMVWLVLISAIAAFLPSRT